MKINPRAIHRDLAYFFLGLIIAFSISGILLNHRAHWNPERYTFESRSVSITPPENEKAIDDRFVDEVSKDWNITGKRRGYRVRGKNLQVDYPNSRVEIDIKTGKGTIDSYIRTPVVSQFRQLHVDTNYAWIWYSDIFGLAMLTIAITGMFIQKGSNGFWQRGWKLASVGIIFPLIFLFLIS